MSFICSVCRELLTCYSDCESEVRPVEASGGVGDPKDVRHLVSTKCGHLYHYSCLQEWLMQAMTPSYFGQCPICCTEVDLGECWRIYPSRDEGPEDLEAVTKEAKDTKEQLEKLSLTVDILRYEVLLLF
ncbi:unnamed protein product [Allacma fusca]|uniref:RING-type domain-containing protein n=1 Tax=Allacma fusca TaxID=39272 RepID=A0A8J2L6Z8_9HEXA|nr:unnamed protein product [Allacma fusca]